ncbi:Phosphate:acyl-ACP acyltransferase PlsX [Christensenella hongkongensis]|uniref:Phosphate acyltransferase n=2 Tax=Christensenella hongkongensis TaxID=270498 RepID=A0A0M2NJS3_9FIRM|nr:Phosphate:acyl-ACP acyltransferase PlsX [Christensenella hongkongensis]
MDQRKGFALRKSFFGLILIEISRKFLYNNSIALSYGKEGDIMRIIIDAMGGDHAPDEIVKGVLRAMQEFPDTSFLLTGDRQKIEALLSQAEYNQDRIEIIGTTQVIEMDDSPVKALKEKKDSSMVVALNALARGEGGMLISAGCTGALVAGATLIVKRINGIKRPALAPVLPSQTGEVLLIDGGANADCKPQYLQQFGVMGSIYMQKVFGLKSPKVALINNGAEEEKGSELTKKAYQLLKEAPINFVGNAEGRELLSGEFDVLVCDGFTGNIVLKFLEGCAKTILGMLKGYIKESASAKLGSVFMKSAFGKLKKKMDYKEYGGALLLGLAGGVMKAHGSSDATAIFHAIDAARKFIAGNVVEEIQQGISGLKDDHE